MTYSATETRSYTTTDIQAVVRRFTTDLLMIAQSTGAWDNVTAQQYAHDVELLATNDYLVKVDLTLLNFGREVIATQFVVNAAADGPSQRPGGLLWPRVAYPELRIVLYYTAAFDEAAREALRPHFEASWASTSVDTSHSGLVASHGRTYSSNGWGMNRTDFQ